MKPRPDAHHLVEDRARGSKELSFNVECGHGISWRAYASVSVKPRAFCGQREAAGIVARAPARRAAIVERDVGRRVGGRRIERMRRVRQHHQRVHLEAQLDVAAGARCPTAQAMPTVVGHATLTKKFTLDAEIALAEAVLAELDQEVVAGVAVEVVALLLIAALAERVARGRASPKPVIVSCQPAVSSTIDARMRPMSE